jgi:hypothetical protein
MELETPSTLHAANSGVLDPRLHNKLVSWPIKMNCAHCLSDSFILFYAAKEVLRRFLAGGRSNPRRAMARDALKAHFSPGHRPGT